jgi:threonine dehydrogenase-like Zn-dependent dehydrogenase
MIRAWRHPAADAIPSLPGSGPGPALLPLVACDLPGALDAAGLAADQVLVRVEASVVGAPELGDRIHWRTGWRVDRTPGGAAVGTVQDAGESATHLLGKRVLVGPDQGCGECDVCRRAGVVVCPEGARLGRDVEGTLATAVVARARWVCVLEGELAGVPGVDGPAAALIAREAAWAYAMFARAGVAPGEPVFIVGNDVVARFLCQIAAARSVRPMLVAASAAGDAGSWVESLGGVAVRIPERPPGSREAVPDPGAARAAAMQAAASGGHGKRPWYIFETSATSQGRALALSLAGPATRLTMLASAAITGSRPYQPVAPGPVPGPVPDPVLGPVLDLDGVIHGVAGAHPDLLPEVAALVVRGELDVTTAAEIVPVAAITPAHAEAVASAVPPRALVAILPADPR